MSGFGWGFPASVSGGLPQTEIPMAEEDEYFDDGGENYEDVVEEEEEDSGFSDEGVSGDNIYGVEEFEETSGTSLSAAAPTAAQAVEAVVPGPDTAAVVASSTQKVASAPDVLAAVGLEPAAPPLASVHATAAVATAALDPFLPAPVAVVASSAFAAAAAAAADDADAGADADAEVVVVPPVPGAAAADTTGSYTGAPAAATPPPLRNLLSAPRPPPPPPPTFLLTTAELQKALLFSSHPTPSSSSSSLSSRIFNAPQRRIPAAASLARASHLESMALASALGLSRPRSVRGNPQCTSSATPTPRSHPPLAPNNTLWGMELGLLSSDTTRRKAPMGVGWSSSAVNGSASQPSHNQGSGSAAVLEPIENPWEDDDAAAGGIARHLPPQQQQRLQHHKQQQQQQQQLAAPLSPFSSTTRQVPPPPIPNSHALLYSRLPAVIRRAASPSDAGARENSQSSSSRSSSGPSASSTLSLAYAAAAGSAVGCKLSGGGGGAVVGGRGGSPSANPHLALLKERLSGGTSGRRGLVADEGVETAAAAAGVSDSVLLQMMLLGGRKNAESPPLPPLPPLSSLTLTQALAALVAPPLVPLPTFATAPSQQQQQHRPPPGGASAAPPPLHAAVLATEHAAVFEAIFQRTVLNLPRLVAEAVGAYSDTSEPSPFGAGKQLSPLARREEECKRRQLAAAVGGPLVAALQDMLTDVDVITLVRESVTGRVREIIAAAQKEK